MTLTVIVGESLGYLRSQSSIVYTVAENPEFKNCLSLAVQVINHINTKFNLTKTRF